jgi:hypothetical protein
VFPIWALGLYRRLVLLGEQRSSTPGGSNAWCCAVVDYFSGSKR